MISVYYDLLIQAVARLKFECVGSKLGRITQDFKFCGKSVWEMCFLLVSEEYGFGPSAHLGLTYLQSHIDHISENV